MVDRRRRDQRAQADPLGHGARSPAASSSTRGASPVGDRLVAGVRHVVVGVPEAVEPSASAHRARSSDLGRAERSYDGPHGELHAHRTRYAEPVASRLRVDAATRTDLWEDHADWWIDGFTDGADPEYDEQILPLAAAELQGAHAVLDVGCGDGQISRLLAASRRRAWSASTRRGTRSASPTSAAAGAAYARSGAAALPFADASFDAVVACLVFEHIDDVDAAIAEVARVLQPGRAVLLLPQPPAAADAEQRLDRRPVRSIRPSSTGGSARTSSRTRRSRRSRRACSSASSTGRCAATSTRWPTTGWCSSGWTSRRRRRLPRPRREYADAATIPRLLYLRLRRTVSVRDALAHRASRADDTERLRRQRTLTVVVRSMADIVLITGLSGAGRSGAAACWRTSACSSSTTCRLALDTIVELASKPGSGIDRLALVAGPPARRPAADRSARCGPTGTSVRMLFLDAIDAGAGEALRRHPPQAPARRRGATGWSRRSSSNATCSSRSRPRPTWSSTPATQRAPAEGAARPRVRRSDGARTCRSRSRASGSSTACRSTPTS